MTFTGVRWPGAVPPTVLRARSATSTVVPIGAADRPDSLIAAKWTVPSKLAGMRCHAEDVLDDPRSLIRPVRSMNRRAGPVPRGVFEPNGGSAWCRRFPARMKAVDQVGRCAERIFRGHARTKLRQSATNAGACGEAAKSRNRCFVALPPPPRTGRQMKQRGRQAHPSSQLM